MKKFLLGVLTGLIFAGLAVVILAFSMVRLGQSRPSVPDGATLVLRLNTDVPEKAPVSIPIPFIGGPTPHTVQELWSTLRRASTDNRVKALVLVLDKVDAGWGKLQEIRGSVAAFKKSGKPVYAFLISPGTREYYVASAADRIYSAPEDMVDLKGLRAELMFVKNTLGKIGVEMQVEHVGRYKDAGDMFTNTSMTPETREALNALLDGIYSELLEAMAQGRKKSVDEIRSIIDDGPYTSRQAAGKGLLDALRFEDQVFGELKDALKQKELKKFDFREYVRALGPERDAKHRIAFLVGEGTIMRSSTGGDAMGTDEAFTSGAFIRLVRQVAQDKSISGVILRVNSPGGDAFASDEMLREIKLLRDKKPMVISMSDYAASGGYYVAMTGDPIVAYPTTITGSIGVLYMKPNLRGLYDKLGIQKEYLTRGNNAAIDSDYGPMTPEARTKLQSGLQEFYHEFVAKAAESRKRKFEDVEPLAQGRVWLGMHAKQNGLLDDVGGIDRAIELVKQKAGLKPEDRVRLVPYPGKRTIWEQLMKSTSDTGSVEARLSALLGFDWRLLLQQGYMRLAPYQVSVR